MEKKVEIKEELKEPKKPKIPKLTKAQELKSLEEKLPMGRPPKFKNPAELQKLITKYFLSRWDYKRNMFGGRIYDPVTKKPIWIQLKPYTITGLALSMGTTRETLMDYENHYGKKFSDTIKRAKEACHNYAEDSLFIGKNPAGAMFNLKNNYKGWEDKRHTEHSGGISLSQILDEADKDEDE